MQEVLPILWQVVFLENPQAEVVFQLQQGFSSSAEPASGQAFPITSHVVLNPLAPTLPSNFGGTAKN